MRFYEQTHCQRFIVVLKTVMFCIISAAVCKIIDSRLLVARPSRRILPSETHCTHVENTGTSYVEADEVNRLLVDMDLICTPIKNLFEINDNECSFKPTTGAFQFPGCIADFKEINLFIRALKTASVD